ncbi:ImmA/IrrE family metallo-endopeptidase [Agathobacter rectalis]|uniref:ImmA/IrrE family metallo-endopeptidase n=1 Tax=Agathobacter rectalis TaxID=39491 RepID=UPI0034A4A66B
MTEYEKLLDDADKQHVLVTEKFDLSDTRLKGLYCDAFIAIDKNLTEADKACVLAEELGHHATTYGNIIDQSSVMNRKQERRARVWAYYLMLQFEDIIGAYEHGCQNRYDIAEYLNISEEFLQDAINYYKDKYGAYVAYDNYFIYFEPLGVLKIY